MFKYMTFDAFRINLGKKEIKIQIKRRKYNISMSIFVRTSNSRPCTKWARQAQCEQPVRRQSEYGGRKGLETIRNQNK